MVKYLEIIFLLYVLRTARPMPLLNTSTYNFTYPDSISDLSNYVSSKNYVQNDNDLPKVSVIKNDDTDVIFLLSRLSDKELLRLLNEQPNKNEYNLNDIIRTTDKSKISEYFVEPDKLYAEQSQLLNINNLQRNIKKRFRNIPENIISQNPVYRLANMEVEPFNLKPDLEPKYAAVQKIKNLLYSRPQKQNSDEEGTVDEHKEMIFDMLVGQLKSLCCKKNINNINHNLKKTKIKSLISEIISQKDYNKAHTLKNNYSQSTVPIMNEYMFLVINDEIKSNDSEELVSVDPESIENNSSVLILGSLSFPMSDTQLKLVMDRISFEFAKPEYLSLLQQLSKGVYSNKRLLKSIVSGPDMRRYIKPHRCNHQSKLSKVYGGPKWIVCTGYLNLNTPSIYDK